MLFLKIKSALLFIVFILYRQLVLFLVVLIQSLSAQNSTIAVDYSSQNFGTIEDVNTIKTEFIITNNGAKDLHVLRADTDRSMKVRINKKTIPPGDTSMLHVTIILQRTGTLSEDIKLVTSTDASPFVLHVEGNIKSIKHDDKTACFYFSKSQKNDVGQAKPLIVSLFKRDTLAK